MISQLSVTWFYFKCIKNKSNLFYVNIEQQISFLNNQIKTKQFSLQTILTQIDLFAKYQEKKSSE